jgi:nucleotide-binding universal stress UspA family protein
MFDKVIVGIDGLAGGRDALALARQLVDEGGEIVLAHVYSESLLPARGSPGIFQAGEDRHSQELLEAARIEAGIEATLHPVASPHVGRGLHELAEHINAALLVVGSSSRGLLGRVLQGDDMRAALNAAPCAVGVAPGGYARRPAIMAEIGVGFDGSPESRNALDVARALAARHGARLSAFEAVLPAPRSFADARHPDRFEVEAEVQRALADITALGGVLPHAAYGEAAEELALYGASVDLLVIGSRAYGPLGRLIHGHTSRQLARSARCPLLVLPRSQALIPTAAPQPERETVGASTD